MITSIQIKSNSYEIDDITRKYALKRIGRLDRYLPRHARRTASAEVILSQVNHDHGNKYEVEVILNVPGKTITAKDSTINIMAAIDIVEAKIMAQLRTYKSSVQPHLGKNKLLSRFKRTPNKQL